MKIEEPCGCCDLDHTPLLIESIVKGFSYCICPGCDQVLMRDNIIIEFTDPPQYAAPEEE